MNPLLTPTSPNTPEASAKQELKQGSSKAQARLTQIVPFHLFGSTMSSKVDPFLGHWVIKSKSIEAIAENFKKKPNSPIVDLENG